MRTSLPETLQAGDTWVWDAAVTDYPCATWTLKFILHKRGSASRIEITATAAAEGGDNYDVEVAAYYTKDYAAGTYDWTAFVEKGAGAARERYTVSELSGSVKILADLETADAATDTRTLAKQILDALEAALLGQASKTQLALTINGRSIQYLRPEELIKARAVFRREVAEEQTAEKIAQGLDTGKRIRTRFA